jgi:hypothetical protein
MPRNSFVFSRRCSIDRGDLRCGYEEACAIEQTVGGQC